MQKNMFGQTKVWMVWQEVDFGQEWLKGVFAGKRTANKAADDMFFNWLADRGMTADTFNGDNPFFVTDEVVQK